MSKIKIMKIWLDDAFCDDNGMGVRLDVDFSNGQNISLLLDPIAHESLYREAVKGKHGKPETDGERVYWPNGASLSLMDMLKMLQSEG